MNERVLNDIYTIRIASNRRVESLSPYCEACKNGVVHLTSVEVRRFTQSGQLPNVCQTCNKEFLKTCRTQIRNMTERESLHLCKTCGKTFMHAGNLRKHRIAHEESLAAVASDSPSTSNFTINGQVTAAMEEKSDNKDDQPDFLGFDNRLCICKHCDKEMANEYAFLKHCQFHVYNDGKNACLSCNELFESVADYKAHILSHEEKCEYICNICPVTFVKISALKIHCVDEHEKVIQPSPNVQSTPKTQSRPKTQNGAEKRQLKCHLCNKTFIQKAAFLRHCQQHTSSESPFKCSTCNKVFASANRLQMHKCPHKKDGIKNSKRRLKYMCRKCKQHFKNRKTYMKHIKSHK